MLMTMMTIITNEKGEAYYLAPKSILLLNIRVILEGEHYFGFGSIFWTQ